MKLHRRVGTRIAAFGLAFGASLPLAAEGPAPAAGEPPPSLLQALGSGTFRVGLRYRLETVDDDAFATDAVASTLRTTLGYETGADFDDAAAATASAATFGAEWTGTHEAGGVAWAWELEAARQLDHGGHPRDDLELDYLHARAAAGLGPVRLEAEWEALEGDGRHAFQTPLATLHKFDGWADAFLTTPPGGLEALAVAASGNAGELGWTVRLWDFSSERTGASYGREADAELAWKSSWGQTFALKAAIYQEDGFHRDVAKAMAWTSWGLAAGGPVSRRRPAGAGSPSSGTSG